MNNDTLNVITNIYKPYRVTKKSNVTILESTTGKFVVKPKKDKNIKELYKYLVSRNFNNFPKLIDGERSSVNIYEYIEEIDTPKEQKVMDLTNLIASLHSKTTYFKEVTRDSYQTIYENVLANISETKSFYNELLSKIETRIYMSPSEYVFARNSSKVFAALDFCQNELLEWYEIVKDKTKARVSVIHNNLDTSHYVKNEREYLISWEKSAVDSPILDFINLYRKEYMDIDFQEILNNYLKKYPLNEDEKKLLFIVIAIPQKYERPNNELERCLAMQKILDYVFKTEDLARPYYSSKEIEE